MKEALENLRRRAHDEINSAKSAEELLGIKTRYLGRKGLLTDILRGLKDVSPEDKPSLGKLSNDIKNFLLKKYLQVNLTNNHKANILPKA